MNWHYVSAGQSVGPISEVDFARLVQSGTIQAETLVWNDTMTDWQPYSQIRAGIAAPQPRLTVAGTGPAPTGAAATLQACSQCGTVLPSENLIPLGGSLVCAACKPLYMQKMREGLPGASSGGAMNYAGFWIRLVAKMVDGLILGAVIGIPVLIMIFLTWSGKTGGGAPALMTTMGLGLQLIIQFGSFVLTILYNWFFLSKYGATPGKMACGLKVVTRAGGPLSGGQALGRAASEILSQITCYIGYIIAAFDSEKRALHDHIAGTRVIKK
jgi:uncharacterized RDD family membrane protein YckC